MTRNLFLGADLRPVYAALADPARLADVPEAVAGIFNPGAPPGMVQRTDFPARAIGDRGRDRGLAARPDRAPGGRRLVDPRARSRAPT